MDVFLEANEPSVNAVWFGVSPIRDGQIGQTGFWRCSKGISGGRPRREDWPDGESLGERPTRSRRPTKGAAAKPPSPTCSDGLSWNRLQGIIQDAARQA